MTTTSSRPFRTGAAALGLSLLAGLTACGGSSASAEEVSATLAIISTNIETAAGSGAFEPATEGQSLVVGDKVKTDATGFAELTYHDGSWQRIEQSATLTIEELTDKGDTDTVKTSIDIGQSWNRVEEAHRTRRRLRNRNTRRHRSRPRHPIRHQLPHHDRVHLQGGRRHRRS